MKKEDIKNKLNSVLAKFGVDTLFYSGVIADFRQKLQFLLDLDEGNYRKLFKNFFSSREKNEFNSYVFEALFAYDFESKGNKLIHEVKQLPRDDIDFLYEIDCKKKIYFELIFIIQRKKLQNL